MKKKYERMSFDIELAKKIQSGEVEGRIVMNNNYHITRIFLDIKNKDFPILVVYWDPDLKKECPWTYWKNGNRCDCYGDYRLFIELHEEEPKHKFEFEPYEKVLVRNTAICNNNSWHASYYSNSIIKKDTRYHVTTAGLFYIDGDIIPYKGNEHLLGTTDKPKEE